MGANEQSFGRLKDPSEAGKKGGSKKTFRKTMAKRMQKLGSMSYEEVMAMIKKMEVNPNVPNITTQLLASGEPGMDTYLKLMTTHLNNKLYSISQLTSDDHEQVKLMKEQIQAVIQLKNTLYGAKARTENKMELSGEITNVSDEFRRCLAEAKKKDQLDS